MKPFRRHVAPEWPHLESLPKRTNPKPVISGLGPGVLYGADDRVRTGDLNLGKVALYQLSYVRRVAECSKTTSQHRRCEPARHPAYRTRAVAANPSAISVSLIWSMT